MARTPLLRVLQRLSKEQDWAERIGLPVEEFRHRRARTAERDERSGHPSRRQFLKGAAAVGAAAALAPARTKKLLAGPPGGEPPTIAIVGAGIAGLSAALKLNDAGYATTLFEADSRVGGRILTERGDEGLAWDDGQHTDIYGELIDSNHRTMHQLANRFNLPMIDVIEAEPVGSTPTFFFNGQYYSFAEAEADYIDLRPQLRAEIQAAPWPAGYDSMTPRGLELDVMTIAEWLDTYVPGGLSSPFGTLLDMAYAMEFGADSAEQSALNLLYMIGYSHPRRFEIYGESDERYVLEGGADRLPHAIADYLAHEPGFDLRLEHKLTRIQLEGDLYTLDFEGFPSFQSDYVILALPFAALRDGAVDYGGAGFDALKTDAIENMGAGRNGKLCLQFTSRFWNQPGPGGIGNGWTFADTGYQSTWDTTRGLAGDSGILVNYTGGSVTDALKLKNLYATSDNSGQVRTDARRFLADLEPVFPGITQYWNGKATESKSYLSPLYKSGYSVYWPGQYQWFAGYEYAPQGRVHFAGEHTHGEFQGWMEGAALTGQTAAADIVAGLRGKR